MVRHALYRCTFTLPANYAMMDGSDNGSSVLLALPFCLMTFLSVPRGVSKRSVMSLDMRYLYFRSYLQWGFNLSYFVIASVCRVRLCMCTSRGYGNRVVRQVFSLGLGMG